jgi:hypothetical protein
VQVIAAAARFFSTDEASSSSSQLLPRGYQPSSCTLALLLRSAAATQEPDLLMGSWKYFGSTWQQQQQLQDSSYVSSSSSSSSIERSKQGRSSSSSNSVLAPPVVLHALVQGSIQCDLAASGLNSSSSGGSSLYGFAAAPAAAAAASVSRGVSTAIFHEDSCTVEVLQDINHRLQQQQQAQQLQQQQHQQQRQREVRPQLPVPLLHPFEASQLLGLTSSTADVDLLLLSQLYQPGGLAADEMVKIVQLQSKQQQQQRQLQQDTSSAQQKASAVQQQFRIGQSTLYSSSSSSSDNASLGDIPMSDTPLALLLPQLDVANLPQFPPCLRADVARAAVASYMRHGAHTRAAAIAHAAAVSNPRDIQQFHLLLRGCAAAGQLLPALVMLEKLRGYFWQTASPKAQAAMLR